MTVAKTIAPERVANPGQGVRLQIAAIAAELNVTMNEMAAAAGTSRTALYEAVCNNRWPVKADQAAMREGLRQLLAQRGANAEQLEHLFHAHVRMRRHNNPEGRTAAPAPRTRRPEVTDVLLAKQTLSPEARRAFELPMNPFDGEVETAEQMFTTGEIRFVRECCWQAAVNARFVAVVGESGSGKSTVLADLKDRIAADRRAAMVIEPSVVGMDSSEARGTRLKSTDILTALVMHLAPNAAVAQTMEKRTRQVERLLAESTTVGHTHLLLIEEAHDLPVATLKHLKRLHERMRLNGRRPMLGILLLGQPELMDKLDERRHDVREVVQRIELVRLAPLDKDLRPYLQHRARQAGRDLGSLIDESGVQAIRDRLTVAPNDVRGGGAISLVYPLAVNNVMTACLNKAAERGAPLVTRDVVLEV